MTVHLPLLAVENSLFKAVGEIFHPLFVAIASVLAWIYGIVPTYAVAIILLTVLIMALLTPLTIKSTRSMLSMQALQPEMQKLRAKYKGAENRQQLNEEMMKLYREKGVSPTGGCLPMFLQMPAFIVLYDVIRGLANTVKSGQQMGTGKKICHPVHPALICATPRYVPHSSAIFRSLHSTPGVMHSIGLNLAARPLTHHSHWYEYIPYFVLLGIAVALQYFQMAQMTRRNKKNNNAPAVPQQMQTMQRVMPLFFAYIYFLVPAGVVIYMIVSSGIRVLTQDMIFRYGLVQGPGERKVGGRPKPATSQGAIDARSAAASAVGGTGPSNGERRLLPFWKRGGDAGVQPATNGSGRSANGSGRSANGSGQRAKRGNTTGSTPPESKQHPRSKSKRQRRTR
ncbi:MAG: YidC/Oxa1 family membrane protein insertase [Acidimicrobiales bacterium]